MTANESGTTIPLIRDNELRLAKMRRQLEGVFRKLNLLRDEITVSADAARSHGLPQLENVLRESVANGLSYQIESLAKVIERLGGNAELSDDGNATFDTAPEASEAQTGRTPGEG